MNGSVVVVAALLLLCLVVGALSQGRWSSAWAALVLPELLVLTVAQLHPVAGPIAVGAVLALATAVAWARVLPGPASTVVSTAAASGVVVGGALAASRSVADVAPLAAPAVVALVITATEVLVSSTFGFALTHRSTALLVLGLVAVASLAVAGHLTSGRLPAPTSRVVGVLEEDGRFFAATVGLFVTSPAVTDEWWSAFRESSAAQLDLLLRRTRGAGLDAELVVWCEGAGLVAGADHRAALDATAEVARATATWVVASWLVLDRESMMMDNVCTVLDATGEIASTCAKRFPVPGAEADRTTTPPGGDLRAVDTPFGRLTVLICFDADHAASWRQVARLDPDVVAIPASDWPAVGSLHAGMALLRARSAGAALVRPARSGVSVVATARGRVVARQDHRHHSSPPLQGAL